MASLELRNQKYRVVFMYAGRKYGYSLDTCDRHTAEALRGGVEKTLMLIGQGAFDIPEGADIVTFVRHGGRPPTKTPETLAPARLSFTSFKSSYLDARSGGSMEVNSLATARMHLNHF